ncbi:MAG: APC family permease, partial [Microcoleus sp. SIO2G3]|nr:APC family permease [Microcoleus sp. SIO2G3]
EFDFQVPAIVMLAFCIGIAWYYSYVDVQLATVLMLITELAATSVILLLAYLVFAQHGFQLDMEQLTLADATPSGISLGMVIAIFSYVGFESAATLGDETKVPFQSIPRAMIVSAMLSGLFFIVLAYAEVLGFRDSAVPLNESPDPLGTLASLTGVQLLGVGLNLGIAFSFFSACLASLNAGSRIAYALARHRFLPSALGEAHKHNKTPHVAISLIVVGMFLVTSLMSLLGIPAILIFSYLGTISTYGFLTAYLLISIAAPVYLARQGQLRLQHLIISLLAGFFMILPIASSFYPVPAFPFNVFPYLFLLYLAAGAWFFRSRHHRPQIAKNIERDFDPQKKLIG